MNLGLTQATYLLIINKYMAVQKRHSYTIEKHKIEVHTILCMPPMYNLNEYMSLCESLESRHVNFDVTQLNQIEENIYAIV